MRYEDIDKIIKGSNKLRKMKLYLRRCGGGKNAVLWLYHKGERKSLGFPGFQLTGNSAKPQEIALLKKAIAARDRMEDENRGFSTAGKAENVSKASQNWMAQYSLNGSRQVAGTAMNKFIEACGDISMSAVSRRELVKVADAMRRKGTGANYIRTVMSRLRAFCNWAEQRGYMSHVDTRKLLPPEEFGEVKALGEEEIKSLASTPIEKCPDVKDLFMLGVYTAQRMGEIKNYTFKALCDRHIKAKQGKTGKFIVIPLSEAALNVMERLKDRRHAEGKGIGPGDRMFSLPAKKLHHRIFKAWLEAAGLPRDRVTPSNSRSTAISLLIKKGVPESVTQELANHASPAITARYYRQIDTEQKKEALDKIPEF
jgi:integrase